uniref:WD_REPEATS_REGION domain-containing protein n=1 Tax=Macrostomum lignano TaxID=282301 RepID=A0A1I8II55_9PLAT
VDSGLGGTASARLLRRLLRGCDLRRLPQLPSRVVRIFTSSTFTDTAAERNALMEHTYPRLKEFCREKHGLDTATGRYPALVDAREFEAILEFHRARDSPEAVASLSRWYLRDENSVPPVYVLQPVSSVLVHFASKGFQRLMEAHQNEWWATMAYLQRLLRSAADALCRDGVFSQEQRHNFFMSVTERENLHGILTAKNCHLHCLAFIRHLEGINLANAAAARGFIDMAAGGDGVDEEAQLLMQRLRDRSIPACLPAAAIAEFRQPWIDPAGICEATHSEYIGEFCESFYQRTAQLIDLGAERNKLPSNDPTLAEVLHHMHLCNRLCQNFHGREAELRALAAYCSDGGNRRPFRIEGDPGCGKTALMARACAMAPTGWQGAAATASSASSCVSLAPRRPAAPCPACWPASTATSATCWTYRRQRQPQSSNRSEEPLRLAQRFRQLLDSVGRRQGRPRLLLLLLDGLEELSEAEAALAWMPDHLPPGVKIVASALAGAPACRHPLPAANRLSLGPLGADAAARALDGWLAAEGRRLSEPLFVRLLLGEARRFRSYEAVAELPLATEAAIDRLLQSVEARHGRLLVSRALSLITASRSGLSEAELEDLLSLDDEVLNDVFQYHLPPVRRLPPLLWSRVRAELPGLLTEAEADGALVLRWHHRQFRSACERRYLRNVNFLADVHDALADYFLGRWAGVPKPFRHSELQCQRFGITAEAAESRSDRRVAPQPLELRDSAGRLSRYNLRKLGQLPHHLLRANRQAELRSECLFNYDFLHAKVAACPLRHLLADLQEALEATGGEPKSPRCRVLLRASGADRTAFCPRNFAGEDRELLLLRECLRLSASAVSGHPDMLAAQLIGRLLPFTDRHPALRRLLLDCRVRSVVHCALVPAHQWLPAPCGPLEHSLEGHQFAPCGVAVSPDGSQLASLSSALLQWDLRSGELLRRLPVPGLQGLCVAMRASGDRFALFAPDVGPVGGAGRMPHAATPLPRQLQVRGGHQQRPGGGRPLLRGPPALLGDAAGRRRATAGVDAAKDCYALFSARRWAVLDWESDRRLAAGDLRSLGCGPDEQLLRLRLPAESGGRCGFIAVFRVGGGRQLRLRDGFGRWQRHLDVGSCAAFSEDLLRAYAATPGHGQTVRLLERPDADSEFSTACELDCRDCQQQQQPHSLLVSPCGGLLAALWPTEFAVWHLRQAEKRRVCGRLPEGLRCLPGRDPTRACAAFSPDRRLLLAPVRHLLLVFSCATGACIKRLDGHFGRILAVEAVAAGNRAVTAAMDRTLKVWDLDAVTARQFPLPRADYPIEAARVSLDGAIALTWGRGGATVWDVSAGCRLLHRLPCAGAAAAAAGASAAAVRHAALRPDGSIAAVAEVRRLAVWSCREGRLLLELPVSEPSALVFSPDGGLFVVVDRLRLRCLSVAEPLCSQPLWQADLPQKETPLEPSFWPDAVGSGCQMALALLLPLLVSGQQLVLRLLEPRTGAICETVRPRLSGSAGPQSVARPLSGWPGCLAVSLDARQTLVLDFRTGRALRSFPDWDGIATLDGHRGLAAPAAGGLRLLELRQPAGDPPAWLLRRSPADGVGSVGISALTPDGGHALHYRAARGSLRLVRLADRALLAEFRLPAELMALACLADSSGALCGCADGSLTLLLLPSLDSSLPDAAGEAETHENSVAADQFDVEEQLGAPPAPFLGAALRAVWFACRLRCWRPMVHATAVKQAAHLLGPNGRTTRLDWILCPSAIRSRLRKVVNIRPSCVRSDHSLLACDIDCRWKKFKAGPPHPLWADLRNPDTRSAFIEKLQNATPALNESADAFTRAVEKAASILLERKPHKPKALWDSDEEISIARKPQSLAKTAETARAQLRDTHARRTEAFVQEAVAEIQLATDNCWHTAAWRAINRLTGRKQRANAAVGAESILHRKALLATHYLSVLNAPSPSADLLPIENFTLAEPSTFNSGPLTAYEVNPECSRPCASTLRVDLDNQRGIALECTLAKLLNAILRNRLLPGLNQMILSLQMGFRPGHSTTEQPFEQSSRPVKLTKELCQLSLWTSAKLLTQCAGARSRGCSSTDFRYLGSLVMSPDSIIADRRSQAWRAAHLLREVSFSLAANDDLKMRLFRPAVGPIFLYGLEAVPMTDSRGLEPWTLPTDRCCGSRRRRLMLVGHCLYSYGRGEQNPLALTLLQQPTERLRRGQGRRTATLTAHCGMSSQQQVTKTCLRCQNSCIAAWAKFCGKCRCTDEFPIECQVCGGGAKIKACQHSPFESWRKVCSAADCNEQIKIDDKYCCVCGARCNFCVDLPVSTGAVCTSLPASASGDGFSSHAHSIASKRSLDSTNSSQSPDKFEVSTIKKLRAEEVVNRAHEKNQDPPSDAEKNQDPPSDAEKNQDPPSDAEKNQAAPSDAEKNQDPPSDAEKNQAAQAMQRRMTEGMNSQQCQRKRSPMTIIRTVGNLIQGSEAADQALMIRSSPANQITEAVRLHLNDRVQRLDVARGTGQRQPQQLSYEEHILIKAVRYLLQQYHPINRDLSPEQQWQQWTKNLELLHFATVAKAAPFFHGPHSFKLEEISALLDRILPPETPCDSMLSGLAQLPKDLPESAKAWYSGMISSDSEFKPEYLLLLPAYHILQYGEELHSSDRIPLRQAFLDLLKSRGAPVYSIAPDAVPAGRSTHPALLRRAFMDLRLFDTDLEPSDWLPASNKLALIGYNLAQPPPGTIKFGFEASLPDKHSAFCNFYNTLTAQLQSGAFPQPELELCLELHCQTFKIFCSCVSDKGRNPLSKHSKRPADTISCLLAAVNLTIVLCSATSDGVEAAGGASGVPVVEQLSLLEKQVFRSEDKGDPRTI